MAPLLDVILAHVPPPQVSLQQPFAMCVAMIERDPFVGRVATGGCSVQVPASVTPEKCAALTSAVQGPCAALAHLFASSEQDSVAVLGNRIGRVLLAAYCCWLLGSSCLACCSWLCCPLVFCSVQLARVRTESAISP
jgi:hypothetical protein